MPAQTLKTSSATQPLVFQMIDSTDHITGKTGLTVTVTLSKNGGAFASPAGAVSEIANGWYKVAGNATDTNTNGPLILHASATGADPVDVLFFVGNPDPITGGLTATGSTDVTAAVDSSNTYSTTAANSTAIANIQNNTFVGHSIPDMLELPDSGSEGIQISVVFNDETGAPKNLDSGNPIVTLVNNAGTDRSGRLGAWTNPATGKYVTTYTNTAGDALEGLHWDVTGTVNSKLRRAVKFTQLVDTTAVDFTSTDRTNLGAIKAKTDALAFTVANQVDANVIVKTGFALSSTGLDSISTAAPSGVASTFPAMVIQLWRRFFRKSTLTATQLKTFGDDGTTVVTTQTVSDDSTTQTVGNAA